MSDQLDLNFRKREPYICPHCGVKSVEYKHNFNKGLVECLKKLFFAGGNARISKLGLTTTQFTNFQKLKYWGLISPEPRLDEKRGYWMITPKGTGFLHNSVGILNVVHTIKGKLIKDSGRTVYIKDVIPGWDVREFYEEQKRSQMRK